MSDLFTVKAGVCIYLNRILQVKTNVSYMHILKMYKLYMNGCRTTPPIILIVFPITIYYSMKVCLLQKQNFFVLNVILKCKTTVKLFR